MPVPVQDLFDAITTIIEKNRWELKYSQLNALLSMIVDVAGMATCADRPVHSQIHETKVLGLLQTAFTCLEKGDHHGCSMCIPDIRRTMLAAIAKQEKDNPSPEKE